MKILVTGCYGQLGNELKTVLEEKIPGVTTYTDVDTLDLTDSEAVSSYIAELKPSHIINCAAYTAVDKAESNPELCRRINADAIKNIGKAAVANGAKVVHVSTDYVFDGTAHTPYPETSPTNPIGVYGRTKREGEQALLSVCDDAVIIRTAWLYSPYGNNFVKTMMRLGRERQSINVVADQIGSPTYARDLASAIAAIIFHDEWKPGIYHFTDEGVASWYDFTKAIHRLAGINNCKVNPIPTSEYPTAASRPAYSVLDKTKIKKSFGIEIPHWEESLLKCISILNENS